MRSVRLRLLIIALLPLMVVLPLLFGITMVRWIDRYNDLLIAKVASDLRVAEQYFGRIEATQAAEVSALAKSVGFAEAEARGPQALSEFLEQQRPDMDLDFLVWKSVWDPTLSTAAREVAMAASPDAPIAHLVLLNESALMGISSELAERAAISLVPTEAARQIDRDVERRGMFILAAYRSPEGDDVLLGGRLLNRNLDVIDTMNALIYRDEDGQISRTGTTTLFLDDVRVSTNVRMFEGSRALGTRVSEVVWRQVMETGRTWLDRAFVVNDWYISGYVPLSDISGNRIGMLYTGFLEAPFVAQRNTTIAVLIVAFIAVIGLSIPFFLWLARGIFSPLERMTATMARAEAGALDARIGTVGEQNEIGAVARHLDRLLDQVEERDASLRDYAENLNDLVEQRTEELREANRKLEATFAKLVMSEKLATVGEITAGVAHEINNPVAVIQGNLEIIRRDLPPDQAAELKTEFDLIDAQTHRINIIVGKLLNFTRPEEMSDLTTTVDGAKAVEDALVLVAADLRKHRIQTRLDLGPAPPFRVVETELQQVIVNLAINAAQAMDTGETDGDGPAGTLTIRTRPAERDGELGTEIVMEDTGPGIPADRIDSVFDPFMTSKLGTGSGLGLSISQTLITRVGGIISVESPKGRGAVFSVWFPAADNLSPMPVEPAQ
ncbi:MAG: cache domain-containing protein [Pseudomonadota bacterium]